MQTVDVYKKILIIDDSRDNQALLQLLLESKGHLTYRAYNGAEALALLAELKELPSLILLDARMPVMDGYEFRSKQKSMERIKDIPVVIMSGDCESDMYDSMHMPDAVLMKPLEISSFFETIAPYV